MNIKKTKKLLNPILTKDDLERFTNRGYSQKKFDSGIVKFSRFYALNKPWIKYLIAITLGLIMSISTVLLVEVTGLYTGGFAACFQGVARLVYASMMKNAITIEHVDSSYVLNVDEQAKYLALVVFNALFWGLYICLNVPLTIFAYKKINKSFAKLSIVYLIALQGMGFVWGIIPGLHTVQIFGDTSTVNAYLDTFDIQSIIFSPNWFPNSATAFTNPGNWVNPVNYTDATNMDGGANLVSTITSENVTKALLLLVYSIVFSLISGLCYTLMFILGGSTAGSDYLTIYLSQEKNKNVGGIFVLITSISMIVGIMLGTYCSGIIIDPTKYYGWQYVFSANLFTSLVWVLLNGFLIDKWFPWHKLVRVEVYSNNTTLINEQLKKVKYTHPATILNAVGGYSGKDTKMFLTVCMVIELPQLIQEIRKVDDKCLISSSYIADIDGYMAVQRQTH